MGEFGHFDGDVVTRWLTSSTNEDRDMELVQPFAYVDPSGKRWEAAVGRIINGATIPPWLWSAVGSPYVGDYRRASVVHDVACDDRTEPSAAVHRMFYDAMRCDGVKLIEGMILYHAVKTWGPHWEVGETVKASRTAPPPLDESDVDHLRTAAQQAVAELGEDAAIEALEARMSDNTRRYIPPEMR